MEYINLPDYKSLATLKAVVELGSVNRAAKALYIGQPAVTKRLRALDACYGMPLMQHQGRKLVLTAAGEKVYDYARLVLDHQTSLLDDLESLKTGHNRLRLEVSLAIGEHVLPDILVHFAETRPDLIIDSRLGYSRRIHTRLATGLSDVALLEQEPRHPSIQVEPWMQDELILVCGEGHYLWGRQQMALDELDELHYVLREPQSSMRNTLDKALLDVDIRLSHIDMEVGSSDAIIELLKRGKQVSFLPHFAIRSHLERNLLHPLPIENLSIKHMLWMAYNQANIERKAAMRFLNSLRDITPNHFSPDQASL